MYILLPVEVKFCLFVLIVNEQPMEDMTMLKRDGGTVCHKYIKRERD